MCMTFTERKFFGKEITSISGGEISITLPDLARGMYYLRVVSGEVVGTKKIFVGGE